MSWAFNVVAFIAAIAAGTLLPLMDLIFGKFVTTFTGFATGTITPAEYRSQVNKYTLYFVYLFIAKFCLVYLHSVCLCSLVSKTQHSSNPGPHLHFGNTDYKSPAHRFHQAHPATEHCILRLRLSCLCNYRGHYEWKQRE